MSPSLSAYWSVILGEAARPLSEIGSSHELTVALLDLLSLADEASQSAILHDAWYQSSLGELGGSKTATGYQRQFLEEAASRLMDNQFRSICRTVPPARAAVLPKMHTPTVGLTLRSLSHYLALIPRSPVTATWNFLPNPRARRSLNLLLLPWPLSVDVSMFKEVATPNAAGEFGFFELDATIARTALLREVRKAIAGADSLVDRIDAVVLPEAAVPFGVVSHLAGELQVVVVGGEVQSSRGACLGRSRAVIAVPHGPVVWSLEQPKHHAWCLDRAQVEQYCLAGRLPASKYWREAIEIEQREVKFGMLDPMLAFCALICEDLARQDPTADVVRAVGPNLVIALLADGPQLLKRWSARYASVLADDPGSSVLTLTSLGMALLSRPQGCTASRVVGLWRDPSRGVQELELPEGSPGLVLALANEKREEFTPDGRSDGGQAGLLTFAGCYPLPRAPVHAPVGHARREAR